MNKEKMNLGWQKLRESLVFDSYRKILKRTFRLPDARELDYEVFTGPDYVVVAAFTADDKLIITKQFRPGPEDYLLGLPSGMVDEGEEAIKAAARELLEETGYEAQKLTFLKETKLNYGVFRQQAFLATGCQKIAEQRLDSTEFIEVELWEVDEWLEILKDPENSQTVNADVSFLALDKLGKL